MIINVTRFSLYGPLCVLFASATCSLAQDTPSDAVDVISDSLEIECTSADTGEGCNASSGRATENVIRQAEDAFGATIGRESIGIYSASNVRGFSAIAAGNARINGLFFDQVAGPSRQIRRSTAIRVGLSALDFPFPAPTGVVDYGLIRPGPDASYSATASADSYDNFGLELDFSLPLADDRLALGGGAGLFRNAFVNGGTRTQTVVGLSALWKPLDGVEIQPFWTRTDTYDNTIAPYFAPAGDALPPAIPRRRFFGQDWAQFDGAALLYGLVSRIKPADRWMIEVGAFRSVFLTERDTFVLLGDFQPDQSGRYFVFTDPPGTTTSTSGEAKLTHIIDDGPRTHRVIASVRGRDRRQLFGGSDVQDYGLVTLGAIPSFPEPNFIFGEQSFDNVEQLSAGVTYSGHWRGIGSIIFGLSKTDYRKRVEIPGIPSTSTSSSPWLYNGSVAIDLTENLAIYGGYTRGLEDSGFAPQSAINRNEALPAIITSQREAGLRWKVSDRLNLIAGVFDVRKPYFSTNQAGFFTQLGTTRNRGIEFSLSGEVTDRLTLVAGAVLLDPAVIGEAVELGTTGPQPVGLPRRRLDINLDWTAPVKGVSLDLRIAHQSSLPANTLNTAYLPGRALVDIGGRYQFRLGSNAATLRIFLRNIGDVRGYELQGSGTFDLLEGRVFGAYLSIDV